MLVFRLIQQSAFVVVAGDWPGSLILLLSLDLPIQGAFFPNRLQKYFKSSRYHVTVWHSVVEFQGVEVGDNNVVYIISGGIDFLWHALLMLNGCQHLIIMINVIWHGASWSALLCPVRDGHAEILGGPYSKKSPLPSIGDFLCLADSPKLSKLPNTWPVKNTTKTYHLLQPSKNRSTIEAHDSKERLLAVSLVEVS